MKEGVSRGDDHWPMRSKERRIRRGYQKREGSPGDAGRGSRPGEAGERRLFIRWGGKREGGREDETRRGETTCSERTAKPAGKDDQVRQRPARNHPGDVHPNAPDPSPSSCSASRPPLARLLRCHLRR